MENIAVGYVVVIVITLLICGYLYMSYQADKIIYTSGSGSANKEVAELTAKYDDIVQRLDKYFNDIEELKKKFIEVNLTEKARNVLGMEAK
jgi:cell division protein FtsB